MPVWDAEPRRNFWPVILHSPTMTSRFSSKTAFQALEVDSGEESEEGVLAPEPEKPSVYFQA